MKKILLANIPQRQSKRPKGWVVIIIKLKQFLRIKK